MKNTDMVTKEILVEVLAEALSAFEERLEERFTAIDKRFEGIDRRFDGIETRLASVEDRLGSLESRIELGFSELNDRLDAEQAFTSDMWDDFSLRLAALEVK